MSAMLARTQLPALDPPGVLSGLGHVGNVVASPAARFDAVWYLAIAEHGYGRANPDFFPLYPLAVRTVAFVIRSDIVAGVIVSLVAFLIALMVLYRLIELDLGPRVASYAVWILALFPTALFFSAIYTESVFLALSVGALYAARRESWALAGLLGGLASATRNVGILLVVPLLILYLEARQERARVVRSRDRPRKVNADDLRALPSIALVPVGLVAYIVGLAISRGTPFAMFDARAAARGLVFPPVTVWRQFEWTFQGVHGRGVIELAFLGLTLVAAVGVVRRLGRAYAAYVVLALLVLLSEPMLHSDPLFSFPRYVLVLFPLWVWVACVAAERRETRFAVLGISAALLAGFTAQFATWRFVA
jgi:hypothetical protein